MNNILEFSMSAPFHLLFFRVALNENALLGFPSVGGDIVR
jgi:hypothetical protein